MCSQLPLPNGFDVGAFLDRRQSLLGAFVGGIMGVTGALIVASRNNRRQRRIAAAALLPELTRFTAISGYLKKTARLSPSPKEDQLIEQCRELVRLKVAMEVLHGPLVSQLFDVDARLYNHLHRCQTTHSELESSLARFAEADAARKKHMLDEPATNWPPEQNFIATLYVYDAWTDFIEHATLAEYFLKRFIFGGCPVWVSMLRMRIFPNDLDRRSAHFLKTGGVKWTPEDWESIRKNLGSDSETPTG